VTSSISSQPTTNITGSTRTTIPVIDNSNILLRNTSL
jgi:hypothetical protein